EAAQNTDELLLQARSHGAVVPALWHWEAANALAVAFRRQRIDAAGMNLRLKLFSTRPIRTDPESAEKACRETLSTALSEGLTAYDAAYPELAERLAIPLATKDAQLAKAAKKRGVALLL